MLFFFSHFYFKTAMFSCPDLHNYVIKMRERKYAATTVVPHSVTFIELIRTQ
jgi:hypothetical protein